MRLRLRHRLHFQFAEPARNVINILRMTPRSHEGQRVTTWRIDIDPDCTLRAGQDHFGNLTHTLTVPGVLSELTVIAQGEVTCFDASGVVRGTAERLPVELYRRETAFTAADEALQSFAEKVGSASVDGIGRLHLLLAAVHETVTVTPEAGSLQPASRAFHLKKGRSEDHAQIFTACARHLGYPARCVSGFYLVEDGPSQRQVWAEAYVENLGWVGFDPVLDICPQDRHIRVAVGLDAVDATVIRGTPSDTLAEDVTVTWLFARDQAERPPVQGQSQRNG